MTFNFDYLKNLYYITSTFKKKLFYFKDDKNVNSIYI